MKRLIRLYLIPTCMWVVLYVMIALCCISIYSHQAHADYLYTGAVSKHLIAGDFNETHELVAYQRASFTLGYFSNSYYEGTAVATYTYKIAQVGDFSVNANAGLTYGYRKCYGYKEGRRVACPYAAPEIVYTKYKVQPVITYLGQAVVFSVRWEL